MSDAPVITFRGILYRVDGETVTRIERTNLRALVPSIREWPVDEFRREAVLRFMERGGHMVRGRRGWHLRNKDRTFKEELEVA